MHQRGLPRGWKKQLVSALVEPEVERILLFGSRARGDAGPHSDLDLLIVRRTEERFLARIGAAYQCLADAAVHLGVDVDVLVYTPEEYQRMLDEGNPLVTRAHREGKVLYEKPVGRSRTLVSSSRIRS
jgi:predicted nucleotidyltransferase